MYPSKKTHGQIKQSIIHLKSILNPEKEHVYEQVHTVFMTLSIKKMCYTLKKMLNKQM